MTIIPASYEIQCFMSGDEALKYVEFAAKHCYLATHNITDTSAPKFVANLIKRGHESTLEHASFSVRFICSRATSHELVRHRLASFSQESQRYCNYENKGLTFIKPTNLTDLQLSVWKTAMYVAESFYLDLIKENCTPQQARAVLPNSCKTELVMTANLREWRHFFKLRTAKDCDPTMLELTRPLLADCKELFPVIFDDISWEADSDERSS